MKVIGLDEKEYSWNPSYKQRDKGKTSELHRKARELLKARYPFDSILEEVGLPGTKTNRNEHELVADFFLPQRDLLVEVNGEQHTTYNTFFFASKLDFHRAKKRDRDKKKWAELNNFRLLVLEFDNQKEWERIINE